MDSISFYSLLLVLLAVSVDVDGTDLSCSPEEESCLNFDPECVDKNEQCYFWAQHGECDKSPPYMLENCPQSCEQCLGPVTIEDDEDCSDLHPKCPKWTMHGECITNPGYMLKACKVSCHQCINPTQLRKDGVPEQQILKLFRFVKGFWGEPQKLDGDDSEKAKTKPLLLNMNNYALQNVTSLTLQERLMCKNNYEDCAFWAMMGECQNNLNFMMNDCSLACHFCHMKSKFQRCKRVDGTSSWMTHGWVDQKFKYLHQNTTFQFASDIPYKQHDDPWVLKVDNFLTIKECDNLMAQPLEWNPSPQVPAHDNVHETSYVRRQSQSAFCENCALTNNLKERLQKLLSVPPSSIEPIEYVHYGLYQSFGSHNDFSLHDTWMPAGPRVLSIFITLNDVEEGGLMGFPNLEWTKIPPKKGQLLIWPNVLNSQPFKRHPAMDNEGLPVRKGQKYGLYAWVRLFDYEEAKKTECV